MLCGTGMSLNCLRVRSGVLLTGFTTWCSKGFVSHGPTLEQLMANFQCRLSLWCPYSGSGGIENVYLCSSSPKKWLYCLHKNKKEKRCASLKVLILVFIFYIVGIWTMAVDVIVPFGCQTKDIIWCCSWCLRDGCRLSTKNHGFLWLQVRCHERQRRRAAERVFCGCSEHNSTCNAVSHWHFHCHRMESFSHGQAEGKDMGAFSGKSDWLGSEYFDIATC